MSTTENNLECEDYSIMCRLPKEILSYIFGILRLEDRKSVRLVCRSWYQYSTCVSITKNEKFVFHRTFSSINDVAKVMLESNYSNFEFQDQPIDALPIITIWTLSCSHRIHSLDFFECSVDVVTIRNIIIYCENLISFTFETVDFMMGKKIFCSSKLFDKLVEEGIKRTKLRTFAMLIHDPFEEIVLNKLFLVYPCITYFVAETISHQWFSYFPISLESLQFKTAPRKLKKWLKACITKSEEGLRLRHLNGVFKNMDKSYVNETVLNFFSSQNGLIEVTLELKGFSCAQSLKNITFQILERCPRLREFRISLRDQSWANLYLEQEEFHRFLALISKLRCLIICFRVPELRSLPFPKLAYLTTLELNLEDCEVKDDVCASFLENCPSLLHLNCSNDSVSDHTLQIIFKYLLKLQTLRFYVDKDCTTYGFTGHHASRERGYSIKRLQQMKHLDIGGLSNVQGVGEIVLEFQFPHLESLLLDVEVVEMLSEEAMIHVSREIPYLKKLEILADDRGPNGALSVKIVNFCKYLKNLHGLFIYTNPFQDNIFQGFVMEHSEEFFSCPSLRFVSNMEYSTFFFNVFTHKVEKTERSRIELKT